MKFGDAFTVAASLFLITFLFSYPLETVLMSTLGFYWGPTLGALVSVQISSMISGYIFALKTLEKRKESLAKISVLFTVLIVFSIVISNAAIGSDFTQWVHES